MKQYKIQYYREILSSYIKTVDKNFLSTPFPSQERKLKIRRLKDLVKISLDFPFFSRWRIKSREGNKDLLGGELTMIIIITLRKSEIRIERMKKKKNCQNGQWNFLTRSRIKKAMHAYRYTHRWLDSNPGNAGKKKSFCETSGRKNLFAVSLSDKKDEKKRIFRFVNKPMGSSGFVVFSPFSFPVERNTFFFLSFLSSLFFPLLFFSSYRESNLTGSEVVVHTESNEISLTNLKVSSSKAGDSRERIRKYGFDYCFDSSNPVAQNFADQTTIYQTLGRTVLDNVFTGYNSCLVAYGQSASGKTYTMMGTKVITISFHYFINLN